MEEMEEDGGVDMTWRGVYIALRTRRYKRLAGPMCRGARGLGRSVCYPLAVKLLRLCDPWRLGNTPECYEAVIYWHGKMMERVG